MAEPVYEGPQTAVDAAGGEEALLDPSAPIIDRTIAGPQIAAPGTPELADAEETLAGAPNAPIPGTVVTPPPTAAPVAVPQTPQAAGAGAFNASQEGIQAATDRAQQGQAIDEVERQRLAQAQQDEDDIRVQRQLEAQSQLDARDDFAAKKTAADEKVRDFKFHDYFEDPKHGSKALARFAVFLGGLGNLGGQAPGSPNRALDGLEQNIKADHEEQLAYLNSAKYFADKQAEGVTDLAKQQASDRSQLELEYANKKLATADKFAELAQTARGKQNYDAAMIEVAKLKKSAYDDQQKVFTDISQQNLRDAQAKAALLRANRHKGGGGGGGSADALSAFEAAAQAIPPGAPVPKEVYALAYKAGFKTKDVQTQVDRARESGKKSLPAKTAGGLTPGELPKDTIFYKDKPIGLAPSGRGGAAGFTKSLIAYDDSLESLEALKKYVTENPILGGLPRGDAYNRAVLAIAATTSANPSDSTTKHEADTLKGLLKVTPKAIQTSIDHIRERREALLGTKRPLPKSAGVDESAPSPQAAAVIANLKSIGFQ